MLLISCSVTKDVAGHNNFITISLNLFSIRLNF